MTIDKVVSSQFRAPSPRSATSSMKRRASSALAPALVEAGVAGPLDHRGAVLLARAAHVQALAAVGRHQAEVAAAYVDLSPTLVAATVAGPLDHRSALLLARAAHVQAHAAVLNDQLHVLTTGGHDHPLL